MATDKPDDKLPRDTNQLAKRIIDIATGAPDATEPAEGGARAKDPAAVERGQRGGAKGGRARADKLTPERRQEIAKNAAAKRWEGAKSY